MKKDHLDEIFVEKNEKPEDIIKQQLPTTSRYVNMGELPIQFKLGISKLALDLTKEIAKLTLIRTKEYAEYIKNKSDLQRLTGELEEALDYWKKRNEVHKK